MEAIRAAGGASGAGLKSIKERKVEERMKRDEDNDNNSSSGRGGGSFGSRLCCLELIQVSISNYLYLSVAMSSFL